MQYTRGWGFLSRNTAKTTSICIEVVLIVPDYTDFAIVTYSPHLKAGASDGNAECSVYQSLLSTEIV